MKAKIEFLLSNRVAKLADTLYLLVIVFLPTQLGRHFFIPESYVLGLRIDYLSPTVYITDILIASLCILFLLSSFSKKSVKLPHLSKVTIVGILFVVSSLVYHAGVLHGSILFWYWICKVGEMIFFGYYTYYFFSTRKQLVPFLIALSIGLVFEVFIVFLQFIHQASIGGLFYVFGERTFSSSTPGIATASLDGHLVLRPYGTLPHPNVLAGYLLLCSLILWKHRKMVSKRVLTLIRAVIISSVFGIMISLSRVATVIVFVVFSWWFFVSTRLSISKKTVFYAVLFLIGVVFMSFEFIVPRFLELALNSESFDSRVDLLTVSLTMLQEHVLFGVGPMQFLRQLPNYLIQSHPVLFIQPVHNIFVLLLVELGIVGSSGVLCILIGEVGRKGFLRIFHDKFVLVFLGTSVVIGLFDHYFFTLQQGQLLFALVLGIGYARIKNHQA